MKMIGLVLSFAGTVLAVEPAKDLPVLENPISAEFLQRNLRGTHPRLVFTPAIVAELKAGLESDPVLQNSYAAIRLNAEQICQEPLLERKMVGRRLLGTSREMLYRINMLGTVYLVEKDPAMLQRIGEELGAVCGFEDWNPSHYLDVAEMSLAVALALDWAGADLPGPAVEMAKQALIRKGLDADGKGRARIIGYGNNWNQVCNGGMVAAALAVAEDRPELAADTIRRALEAMPRALVEYQPDGVYPEGSTYWEYGTGYSVMTIAMLESALGRDFGLASVPGFMQSAVFRAMCNAPSGMYFNFADCGDRRSQNGDVILAWFASRTGNKAFFEKERFLFPAASLDKLDRLAGAGMAWLAQYREQGGQGLPLAWKGGGDNPVVVFSGGESDPHQYYFGGKGGRAGTSHGNMDAGAFVFELDGIRWGVDPGNQDYNTLEKTGFNLWGMGQDSQRWTLLTKNNFGHSTLTVNDAAFVVGGFAPLVGFKQGERPEAAFDLTAVYGGTVKSAVRRFSKDSPVSLLVEDRIETSQATRRIVWQLVTTADVEPVEGGAVLRKGGRQLRLQCLSHPKARMEVVSLDPPPLALDRKIDNLKRIEIEVPVGEAADGAIDFKVRLVG